jgi:soluble P-type ATPase
MIYKNYPQGQPIANCCGRAVQDRNALYWRSVVSIMTGLLLMFPQVEVIVLHGFLAAYVVPGLFVMFAYFLYKDYRPHLATFCLSGIGFYALLYAPFLFSVPGLSFAGLVAIGFALVGKLTIRFEAIKEGLLKIDIDRVIVLMSALSGLISMMHVLGVMGHIGHFMLHETFLAIGAVNYSAYLQSSYKGHHYQHAVGAFYGVQKGDVVEVNKLTRCPYHAKAMGTVKVLNDEETVELNLGDHIQPGVMVLHGAVKVIKIEPSDVKVANSRSQDRNVQLFFLGLMGLAAVVSGIQGWLAHSMLKAIEQFILNISVLCPCVFLVTKPVLIQSLFARLQQQKPKVDCNIAPSASHIDTVVFDRTHTLYHPQAESSDHKDSRPYKIHPDAKSLLERLKTAGKEIYIVSGHNTTGWREHHTESVQDLKAWVDPKNIIFDSKYHDPAKKEKAKLIKKWQKQGKKVCMVGDGVNDACALEQADLSIAMRYEGGDAHPEVLKHSNYCISKGSLGILDQIIDQSSKIVSWINRFSWIAIAYHVAILALVNGGYFYLFSSALPEMIGSVVMSLFCVISQFLTQKVAHSLEIRKPLDAKKSEHIHNHPHHHHGASCSCCHHNPLTHLSEIAVAEPGAGWAKSY